MSFALKPTTILLGPLVGTPSSICSRKHLDHASPAAFRESFSACSILSRDVSALLRRSSLSMIQHNYEKQKRRHSVATETTASQLTASMSTTDTFEYSGGHHDDDDLISCYSCCSMIDDDDDDDECACLHQHGSQPGEDDESVDQQSTFQLSTVVDETESGDSTTFDEVESITAHPDDKDEDEQEETLRQTVLQTITFHCLAAVGSAPPEEEEIDDLTQIGSLLREGAILDCQALGDGETHQAYRVFVRHGNSDLSLFAKVQHYDTKRTQNEFDIMNNFRRIMDRRSENQSRRQSSRRRSSTLKGAGGAKSVVRALPVAKPYFCVDLPTTDADEEQRLLVTQWISSDNKLSHDFAKGHVDRDVLCKVARALATLNASAHTVESDVNAQVRPGILSLFQQMKSDFASLLEMAGPHPEDACARTAQEVGVVNFDSWVDRMAENYERSRDALLHGDAHAFNMLIEKQQQRRRSSVRGSHKNADLYLCDWELSHVGPKGMDVGTYQAWPIACSLAHARQGNRTEAYALLDGLDDFWDDYAAAMMMMKKDSKSRKATKESLRGVFRNAMGWNSMFLFFGYYTHGIHLEHLPLYHAGQEEDEQELLAAVKAGLGELALRFMRYGFGQHEADLTLRELRGRQRELLVDQIEALLRASRDDDSSEDTASQVGTSVGSTTTASSGACYLDDNEDEVHFLRLIEAGRSQRSSRGSDATSKRRWKSALSSRDGDILSLVDSFGVASSASCLYFCGTTQFTQTPAGLCY